MTESNISINIPQIIRKALDNKRFIILSTLVGLLLGVLYALSMVKQYKAEAKIVPEERSPMMGGSMGSLASLAGINLNSMGSDAISTKLYPQVLGTKAFVIKLFDIPVTTKDGRVKTTYAYYIQSHQLRSPLGSIFGSTPDSVADLKKIDEFRLTKLQEELVLDIGKRIMCSVDDNTDVVTLSVTDQDPLVAAIVTDVVMKNIQEYIVDYRTGKARNDLQNTKEALDEAKEEYVKAQRKYAAFAEANESLVLQSYVSKRDELENEMQLRYNIYSQLQQQYQMAQSKVQEKTPVYAILQPSSVPTRPTGLGRVVAVAGFMLIGFFFGLVWVFFVSDFVKQISKSVKAKD